MPIHPSDPADGSFLEIIKAVLRGDRPQPPGKYKYEKRKKRQSTPPAVNREAMPPDYREFLDKRQKKWEQENKRPSQQPGYSLPKHRYEDASMMLRPNQPAMPGMGDQTPTIEDLKALERSMEHPDRLFQTPSGPPPDNLEDYEYDEEDLTPFPDLHHRRRMRPSPQMQKMMDDIMEEENRAPPPKPTRPQEDIDREMREMMKAYENEMGIPIGFKENLLKHGRRSKNVEEAPPLTPQQQQEYNDLLLKQTEEEYGPFDESPEMIEKMRKQNEWRRLKERSRLPDPSNSPDIEKYDTEMNRRYQRGEPVWGNRIEQQWNEREFPLPDTVPIPQGRPLEDLIMSLLRKGQQV